LTNRILFIIKIKEEKMRTIRVAIGQINPIVGDLSGNVKKIIEIISLAKEAKSHIVIFPELAITGYPPEDLLLKPSFIKANLDNLSKVIEASSSICTIVGFVGKENDIFNSAAVIHDQKLLTVYNKIFLPNYSVFDEDRYFQPGSEFTVFKLLDTWFGVNICEDIWHPGDPIRTQAFYGNAEIILNISASPYHIGKNKYMERMLAQRASDYGVILVYVNLVGGQDELVFAGNSMVFDESGKLITRGKAFEEDLIIVDLFPERVFAKRLHDPRIRKEKLIKNEGANNLKKVEIPPSFYPPSMPTLPYRKEPDVMSDIEEIYHALVLGTKDYMKKNGFSKAVIGLSGGIDSSLVAALTVEAIGKENILGVLMPSQYTSKESIEDAKKVARNLGIEIFMIPIQKIYNAFYNELSPYFQNLPPDITEENLQARIRGNILMAISNKFKMLLLSTGNKSEVSTGYCTLYGDMAGGFSVIKDVKKTVVYELARFYNKIKGRDIIPERVLIKPPSAELKPNQKDEDTLPPYDTLDPILELYVEQDKDINEIASMGFDKEKVKEIMKMVDRNEYKRRQGSPGIRITARAFGKDRRLPITNKFNVL